MFDRFIRLARARKALREQRFLDALQQARDPLIADDRRAERIREGAIEQLVRRARTRLEQGDLTTARAEAARLGQLADGEAVRTLASDVDQAVSGAQQQDSEQRSVRGEFLKLLGAGDLPAAEDVLATWRGSDAERASMAERLAARRREAVAALEQAVESVAAGSLKAAAEAYASARSLDRALPEAARSAALRKIAEATVAAVRSELTKRRPTVPQLVAGLACWSTWTARLPELQEERSMQALAGELGPAIEKMLAGTGSLDDAVSLARAVRHADWNLGESRDDVVAALAALAGDEGSSAPSVSAAAALAQLQDAASHAGWTGLASLARQRTAGVTAGEDQLTAARELLEQGQLEAARTLFVQFLQDHPMHEGVQKELELLDESLAELDRRLADLRMTLRAGKLRDACTQALALTGTSRIADEAQQILAEARQRMALVDKGVDEVLVSLHGRATSSLEGVRHCLKRLEELHKVQVDHQRIPKVIEAVQAEIAALEACDKLHAAMTRGDCEAVLDGLPELVDKRAHLLAPERIDARLCRVGDEVVQMGERAFGEGRLSTVARCGHVLHSLEPVDAEFANRAADWTRLRKRRENEVAALLEGARECLQERDLAGAEQRAEKAQQLWCESADVTALQDQLLALRNQTRTLEQVAAMAQDKDFLGAHQKLASIPNVPPMLRTRVYDMKQDLARAQGLEGAFLLRVDEGGEQLVMRGESVSIGNVRQGSADLPVLANLAGRHATIRRSMSFHGGMEDVVVADDGEVRIKNRKTDKHTLTSGDRIELGPALRLHYEKPTSRSLTSRVVLQSGFQVAGTDRVLLMKDRGRDGRILLGPGRDVHVTVAKATGEVELFANRTGQMRVFCEQGGEIDGAAFKGEHPIAAGQILNAVGITFLLLPWQPH